MWHVNRHLGLALLALSLSACGGSGDNPGVSGNASPARGTLLQNPPQLLTVIPAASLLIELGAATNPVLPLSGTPLCNIAAYQIRYATVGGANEATSASGALMVPTGSDPICSGARPIVLYAHGTTTDRAYNIADLGNQSNAEGLLLAAFFASQGYIVVAPNYAGYDSSTLSYHPFLNAAQQSKDMIDALAAARSALPAAVAASTRDSGQLFITGYSEGGYVAMATQRAMQAAGMPVSAAAPMSGPYAPAAMVDAVFAGEVNDGAPVFATLLITGYQKSYGNIYGRAADVFESLYSSGIDALLPSTLSRSQLYAQGKLPSAALFSLTPPDPEFAADTPATTPAGLAATFALGFGAGNLITNGYRLGYLLDAQGHPDGGWPLATTGITAVAPAQPLRQALKLNDLRDWVPAAPTLLCGGDADPTVYWLNAQLMQTYWAAHAPAAPVSVLDLESSAGVSDPYVAVKTQFEVAKALFATNAVLQGATDGGRSAVAAAYHSTLVSPFCLEAVRSFFAAQ